jgi:uncharacterized protein involved in exopolysaccharide biosynthesis
MMQSTQTRIQQLAENANRDRDRLISIEQLLAESNAAAAAAPRVVAAPGADSSITEALATPAQQLEVARAALRNLELRLKPEHPDVTRTKRMIAELEAKVAATTPEPTGDAPQAVTVAATSGALTPTRASELRLQADEIRRRLDSYKAEQARLEAVIGGYTTRLEATPGLESELSELMRDYTTLQEAYTVLLKKSEESKIAVNLERRQIGQQFRIIDSPRLPERPVSPNRSRLNLMGLLAGLGLGLGLVAFMEYRDTTVKTDDDILISLSLPVLAVIPAMVTERERALRRRRMLVAVTASAVVAVAGAAVVAWQLGLLDRLVR